MNDILNELLGFVDTDQLAYVDEPREGLNRARLVQGNPEFEKDPQLNQTVRYLGGIGLSIDGLNEKIVSQGAIVTINEKDYVTFPSLETVVLTSSRIRRFYAEIDGNQRLACGTNRDGQGARGWSGVLCKQCPYFPKNFDGDKQDACKADVAALVYFPQLDHIAILSFHGASYMEATTWLDQIGRLSRALAQKPEVQAKNPGLARMNPWFFHTALSAGPFEKGNDNNRFQRLLYTKAEQPFNWESLLNSPATVKRVTEIWAELEPVWKQLYVDHNPNAANSLPSAEAVAALATQGSATTPPARQLETRVTVPAAAAVPAPALPAPSAPLAPSTPLVPAIGHPLPATPSGAIPATAPALPAAAPAIPVGPSVPVGAMPAAPAIPGVAVSSIPLDDADVQPVTVATGF